MNDQPAESFRCYKPFRYSNYLSDGITKVTIYLTRLVGPVDDNGQYEEHKANYFYL